MDTYPEVNHAPIKICFTPDEEVGRGCEHYSLKEMGKAKYAYTLDGGPINAINFETFNAYAVNIDIQGISIHPGSAKNIMVNAALLASEFVSLLPKDQIPSKTEGYEGFNHLSSINGSVDHASIEYILTLQRLKHVGFLYTFTSKHTRKHIRLINFYKTFTTKDTNVSINDSIRLVSKPIYIFSF